MVQPVICFGQQPSGFFPKRFFVAKIETARKIHKEIGGRIVLFYHDSDSDSRETVTPLRNNQSQAIDRLNFLEANKIQKKYSPLYRKTIMPGWQTETARRLPRYVGSELVALFSATSATTVADFCLDMYARMGLLEGIEVIRSSSEEVRLKADDLEGEYYADVPYEGETVRARVLTDGRLTLHRGGDLYIDLPSQKIEKSQISPARDNRFGWMQSVIHCTHYVIGAGERSYLETTRFPEVSFIDRAQVADADLAWTNTIQ